MIQTQKIELTSDEFFYLLVTIYIKKRWILLIWVVLLIFFLLLTQNIGTVEYLLILAILAFHAILLIQYWIYSHSKANQVYLLPRYFEIDTHQIVERIEDGSTTSMKTEQFIKVMKTGKCYLLFVAKNEYVYLPFDAFRCDSDREWFENEIVKKMKN